MGVCTKVTEKNTSVLFITLCSFLLIVDASVNDPLPLELGCFPGGHQNGETKQTVLKTLRTV